MRDANEILERASDVKQAGRLASQMTYHSKDAARHAWVFLCLRLTVVLHKEGADRKDEFLRWLDAPPQAMGWLVSSSFPMVSGTMPYGSLELAAYSELGSHGRTVEDAVDICHRAGIQAKQWLGDHTCLELEMPFVIENFFEGNPSRYAQLEVR